MSLIHEALEKAELEKKGEEKKLDLEIPDRKLESPIEKGPVPKEKVLYLRNAPLLYGISGGLLLLFLLGLFYLLIHSAGSRHLERDSSPSFFTPSSGRVSSASGLPRRGGRFSLTGITGVGADRTAIINNELVRVGDQVSGAEVLTIKDQEVILSDGDRLITLSLY